MPSGKIRNADYELRFTKCRGGWCSNLNSPPPAIATADEPKTPTLMEVFERSGRTQTAEAGTYRRVLTIFEACVRQYEDAKEILFLNPKVGDGNRDNLIVIPNTGTAYIDHRIGYPVVVPP